MTEVAPEAFRPINLRGFQRPGERSWELPPWNHPISQGIYPLFVIKDERIIPIATAFLVSRLGIVATAYHNVIDALRFHRHGERLRIEGVPNKYYVDDMQLSILHHVQLVDGTSQISLVPLKGVYGGPPSDVLYGVLAHDPHILWKPFSLSPGVPRVGSAVLSVGYCDMQPAEGIPIEAVRAGTFDWLSEYSHRLRVWEGHVQTIFPRQFAASYCGAPCFLVDFEVEQGLSGGPTFNDGNFVCGINWAGISNMMDRPSSLVSMIYPTLPVDIQLVDGSRQTLLSLIESGKVIADSTVSLVNVQGDADRFRVDPLIHLDDADAVFGDGHGYEEKVPATPISPSDTTPLAPVKEENERG